MTQISKPGEAAQLDHLAKLASYGDADACSKLHALLAMHLNDATTTGMIPAHVARMLADMHGRIADGEDAAAAMRTKPPANRRVKRFRDERIVEFIGYMLAWRAIVKMNGDPTAKEPSMTMIYKQAARAFGLKDHKQVERIHKAATKPG
ncbi:MAG TPA: hypothetical protein VJ862_13330 [Rhodanobacteraceae bacterium]|nr:hypothetical protein [Rhodanobacteraceae bacterium]